MPKYILACEIIYVITGGFVYTFSTSEAVKYLTMIFSVMSLISIYHEVIK